MRESPVIVHGPQGCGKTRAVGHLRRVFGREVVIDPWEGGPLPPGALALTNAAPPYAVEARVVDFRDIEGVGTTG
ncbi:MAG: hypothetical protein U9Q81_27010 [Pseudomonadota bacterium]|nr:hypothetical protein [Pseudomonadota bacterium]